jgi:hypothetical protein
MWMRMAQVTIAGLIFDGSPTQAVDAHVIVPIFR